MDIYIKPAKKAAISERRQVYIKDFAEVVATADVAQKVRNMKVLDIGSADRANYLISVTDIVKVIQKTYPNYTVNNLGEMDTVIDYAAKKSVDNPAFKWLKIAFVTLVLFAGSATAIMSFHSDAQMSEVFKNYYKIFFGVANDKPYLIDIPYSLGLGVGIIAFFNHFAGKKITGDPTPIEVEMSLYETSVTDTVVDILNTQQLKKEEGGKDGGL